MYKTVGSRGNPWRYWRPIYRYTWAFLQQSSYLHFSSYTRNLQSRLIIDLGTGTGEYISKVGASNAYIFSDIDAVSLEKAANRASAFLPEGCWRVQLGDAREVVATAPQADVVSVIHVISVVEDPGLLIQTALDNLKPDGRLLIYISRFSRYFQYLCSPLNTIMGFRLINVEKILPNFTRESAGWFNYCYVVRKAAE